MCHDTVERDRLIADPLVRVCLDHMTAQERSALENDLQLAAQVQRGLLPRPDVAHALVRAVSRLVSTLVFDNASYKSTSS